MAPSVFIVDDHQPFRFAARQALEQSGFEVIGEAADGSSALTAIPSARPEIVLLDINLPDQSGFDVARRLAERGGAPLIVFMSGQDSVSYRRQVAASIALGFLPKSEFSATALCALLR